MEYELRILESRNDPGKEGPAAIVRKGVPTPPQFAVIDTVKIPDHLAKLLAPIIDGNPNAQITFARSNLIALFTSLGSVCHKGGVEHGIRSTEI